MTGTEPTHSPVLAIVLAAGEGTRMKSPRPKVLHEVGHRPLVLHVLDRLARLSPPPAETVVVLGAGRDEVEPVVAGHPLRPRVVEQKSRRGTGDAVRVAMDAVRLSEGIALVLCGDVPLIDPGDIARLIAAVMEEGPAIAVLGFRPEDPTGYGRLVTDAQGKLVRIVEEGEANAAERRIGLVNSGVIACRVDFLRVALPQLAANNAKGELYLTDLVALAVAAGRPALAIEARDPEGLRGVNSQADLAAVEALFQRRQRAAAMAGGVTLIAPESVHFAFDTKLAPGTVVAPFVVFGPGVVVHGPARIEAFSHLAGVEIMEGAVIGPFARLRPGSRIGPAARVGNFVEVKAATLGEGAKANHLSYIGDAEVGARANIGAGTITCNYDGFAKHRTVIGADAFIGSNTALVAPVVIGAGAIVGAGSAITRDVPADALGLTRAPQEVREGAAARIRSRKAGAGKNRVRES